MENTVKQRLIAFIDSKGISKNKFEKLCNLSSRYVSNISKSISPDKIKSISLVYPELNIDWLLTGNGEMVKRFQDNNACPIFSEEPGIYGHHKLDMLKAQQGQAPGQPHSEEYWKELVASQQRIIERQAKTIEEQSNVISSLISQKNKRAV
jgi:hypothetical protein|nr:MAG TPA: Transcriptional regulator motif, XRE transcription factor.88A [Caudoviricetes sp.]